MMPSSTADPCGCAEEMSADMCCTLVLKVFHIDDDQKAVEKPLQLAPIYAAVSYPLTMEYVNGRLTAPPSFLDTSPPHDVSATILNCAFLI
jgi:hypothetical protein